MNDKIGLDSYKESGGEQVSVIIDEEKEPANCRISKLQ